MDDNDRAEIDLARRQRALDEAEIQRGIDETRLAQQAGPPGSFEREAAFRDMEQRAYDEEG